VRPVLFIALFVAACLHAEETDSFSRVATARVHAAEETDTFSRASTAQVYFEEGLSQVQRENYHGAVNCFRSAIEYDPELAEAQFNLGACYDRLGQFAQARPYYQRALELDQANARLHHLYGMALMRQGLTDEGIAALEQAVYLAPRDIDCLYNLAVGYVAVTQYAMAAASFEQVTSVVPSNSVVWFNLGLAYLYLQRTNDACAAWEHVELDSPVAAEAYYRHGEVALARGDAERAMSDARMALALDPQMEAAQFLCAELHRRARAYRAAVDLLEQLHLRRPSPGTERMLAETYCDWAAEAYAEEEYAQALDRYRQAARFTPTVAAIQIGIARSALGEGRRDVARAALERARLYAAAAADERAIVEIARTLESHTPVAGGTQAQR
jgi:tetratricopeptide (TPR) repeat protein